MNTSCPFYYCNSSLFLKVILIKKLFLAGLTIIFHNCLELHSTKTFVRNFPFLKKRIHRNTETPPPPPSPPSQNPLSMMNVFC